MIIRLIERGSILNTKKFGQIGSQPISEELFQRLINENESYEDLFEIVDDDLADEDKE